MPPYAFRECTVAVVTVGGMRGYRSTAGRLMLVCLFVIIFSFVLLRKICF